MECKMRINMVTFTPRKMATLRRMFGKCIMTGSGTKNEGLKEGEGEEGVKWGWGERREIKKIKIGKQRSTLTVKDT